MQIGMFGKAVGGQEAAVTKPLRPQLRLGRCGWDVTDIYCLGVGGSCCAGLGESSVALPPSVFQTKLPPRPPPTRAVLKNSSFFLKDSP